jgi:TolB-like protein/DNA-binding winged helix-turn-helix (wHTH) protein/tetratricopeptide (TPR) repeat protein
MLVPPAKIYEFGPFRLDFREHKLLRNGSPVALTPKAFDVLGCLLERGGQLVRKEELMQKIWADSFVEEANLARTVWMLRKALDPDQSSETFIETVPKLGYRFAAHLTEIAIEDVESSNKQPIVQNLSIPQNERPEIDRGPETRRNGEASDMKFDDFAMPSIKVPSRTEDGPPRRRSYIAISAVLLSTISLAAFVYMWRTRSSTVTVQPSIRSVAVLPLKNLSGDATQEYLVDGMTEGLVASLSRAKLLRVSEPKSTIVYKETSKTWSEIAHELGVEALVVGSFDRDGESIRVDSQLIDASAQKLWSGSYTRRSNEIWALQNEISREISGKLGTNDHPQGNDLLRVNAEAYDLYLRGRFQLRDESAEGIRRAIDLQEQATKLDPSFALAYAELARACNLYAFHYTPEDHQWEEKAFAAAERAILLQPDLAEAHLARGFLLWTRKNNFPHEQAIAEYKQALDLNPSLEEARYQLGRIYMHVGLFDKANAEYQLALAINPAHVVLYLRLAVVKNLQHNYEESLKVQDGLPTDLEASTLNYQRAWSLCHLKRYREALALVEKWRKSDVKDDEGGLLTSIQALLMAHIGDEQNVEKYANLASEQGNKYGHFHHSAYTIAAAYAIVNKPKEAMKWLRFAADSGFPCYPLFADDPDFQNLQQDGDFNEFMLKQKEIWEMRMKTL